MRKIISFILAAVCLASCLSFVSCTGVVKNEAMTDYVYITKTGETLVGYLTDSTTAEADRKLAGDIFKKLGDGAGTEIKVTEYTLSESEIQEAITSKKIDLVITVAASADAIEGTEKSSAYTIDGVEYVILLRKDSDLTEKINNYISNHSADITGFYGEE